MPVAILIGASGSGKTTIARAISERFRDNVEVLFFDWISVPAFEDMVREYGSSEAWQRAIEWMGTLAKIAETGRKVVFEGQTRLAFVAEGAAAAGWSDYIPILVDCDDETRGRRLIIDRQQPELANSEMMSWANYLRREAKASGCDILDTSAVSLDQAVSYVIARTSAPL
ncbi:AAA family ATPase [Rhizobium sullae]|uniref:AAA domain-containing protein n=1 Tax=Rhizobium sullae TaxID=50338 RepID=A0A4R3PQN5_RHISU|nr:AAA family ATPase [Rhizobium sullae]TCU03744.1 AAA domain-containing protein [Rhizobium sullae]